MRLDICIPIYNEEKIIKESLLEVWDFLNKKKYEFDWKIIVSSNGSTDNSEKIVRELIEKFGSKLEFMDVVKKGKGLGVKTCWEQSDADFFCYFDSDLATSMDYFDDLIYPLVKDEADLVFGSRMMEGANTKRSIFRGFGSKVWVIICRKILNHNFTDLQCGFKAAKTDLLKENSDKIIDENFFFDTELVYSFHCNNYRLKEIPVEWQEGRFEGRKSTVNLMRDSWAFLVNVVKLRARMRK